MSTKGYKACRLHTTTDATVAVCESEISFVCVGTPNLRNGKPDLRPVERVCQEIGQALRRKQNFHLVVLRSTVLPGTTERLVIPTLQAASGKRTGSQFTVCVKVEILLPRSIP